MENTQGPEDQRFASFNKQEVINLAKTDVNFLGGLALPDVFTALFPPIFLAIWQLITESVQQPRGLLQLAIGLPRGFGKTLFLKIYVVYCILFTDRQFILVVCNTEQLAMNFISDVFDVLSSTNIKAVFGDWELGKEKDSLSLKKFGFRGRNIIVAGIGVGTSMRGLNIKYVRPDVVVMDDMQSREDAENSAIANKQLIWMMGTLMKARNYRRCLFLFVGNLYPFDTSILKKLKYNKHWISFICGGILADGKSLWEEVRPLKDLLLELENDIALGHPEVFFAEVLNDETAGTVGGLDVSKIPEYPVSLQEEVPQGGFIIIDPSAGKQTSDDLAIGVFLIYDGTPVFQELVTGKLSPLETIHTALSLAAKYKIRCVLAESNAYQATLLFWFTFVCQQLQVDGFTFGELHSGTYSKNSRIRSALAALIGERKVSDGTTTTTKTVSARPLLHPSVRSRVVHQIVHWNPLKRDNVDDILDLIAYCDKAIELFGHVMDLLDTVPVIEHMSEKAATSPQELELSF